MKTTKTIRQGTSTHLKPIINHFSRTLPGPDSRALHDSEFHKSGALLSCMLMHLNRHSYKIALTA